MPISPKASFTSSNLNGFMIASIFFMPLTLYIDSAYETAFEQHRCQRFLKPS
jgi:hypothetical protein